MARLDHSCGVLVGTLVLMSLVHGCSAGVEQARYLPSMPTPEATRTEATPGTEERVVSHTTLGDLIAELRNGTSRAQLTALQELGEMGSSAQPALPAIIDLLASDDRTVGWEAGITLQRIDPREPVGSLAQLVDADPGVRRAAVNALAARKQGHTIPGPLLLRLLADADIGTSELRLLGGSLDADGVAAIRTGLMSAKSSVRAAAARALGGLGDKADDAVPALTLALDDRDGPVRNAAARALVSLGEKAAGAVPALIRTSAHDELSVRELSESLRTMMVTAIPALLAGLQDSDASVRATAAEVLGLLGRSAEEATPALVAAARDSDASVRAAVVAALGSLGGRAHHVVPSVIAALQDSEVLVRAAAARALGVLGHEAHDAVAALTAALNDRYGSVRGAATRALASRGEKAAGAVPALIRMSAGGEFPSRDLAELLRKMIATAIPALLAGLQDSDASVRATAAEVLGLLGRSAEEATPALVAAARDSHASVRAAVVVALGSLDRRAHDIVPSVIAALQDSEVLVRAAAARALGALGKKDPEAVPVLVAALQDGEAAVRRAAARALGSLGDQAAGAVPALIRMTSLNELSLWELVELSRKSAVSAVPALIAALRDSEIPVRATAAQALGALRDQAASAVPALIATMQDRHAPVRAAAAGALGSLGTSSPEVVPALTGGLRDGDASVRTAAIRALASLGEKAEGALPELIAVMQDRDPSVRAATISVLGSRYGKTREVLPALTAGLRDSDASVRAAAARALSALGKDAVGLLPMLIATVRDHDASVRAAAVSVLGSLGGEARDTVPEVIAALEASEPESELAMAAATALQQIDPSLVDALQRTIATAASDGDRSRAERAAFLLGQIVRAREQTQRQEQVRLLASLMSRLKLSGDASGVEPATRVGVYFATDRNLTGSSSPGELYGTTRGDLTFGVAEVSVPPAHRRANLEVPSVWKFELRADPGKHFVLRSVEPLDRVRFLTRMNADLGKLPSGKRSVTIFIHGYRVSFQDAVLRAAQIAYDLRQGVAGLFTWPSKGRLASYQSDEAAVVWATSHLKEFIGMLQTATQAEEINVIGHSMGNRALTAALNDLAPAGPGDDRGRLGNVVFAAPDVDRGEFLNLQDRIKRMAKRTTLYASSTDWALAVSSALHEYPRAGQAGADIVVVEGIDTIDATAMNTDLLNHSYYSDNRSVVDDLFYLVTGGLTPDLRAGLRQRRLRDVYYWVFQP